jgi:hypothetical protein
MMRFKEFLTEDPLGKLVFILAIRKEFGMTKTQAEAVIEWLVGDTDWDFLGNITPEVRAILTKRWPSNTEVWHPGMIYSDHVMDQVSNVLRDKYQLDSRELIGMA